MDDVLVITVSIAKGIVRKAESPEGSGEFRGSDSGQGYDIRSSRCGEVKVLSDPKPPTVCCMKYYSFDKDIYGQCIVQSVPHDSGEVCTTNISRSVYRHELDQCCCSGIFLMGEAERNHARRRQPNDLH